METVLGSLRVEMARRACLECGRSGRPRERRLDFEQSMTPSARRLASMAGSQASYAHADERMKCAGMRWTVTGANPVLWLRCARLGGSFDDYWDDRIARLAA